MFVLVLDCSDCLSNNAVCIILHTFSISAFIHFTFERFPNQVDRFSKTLWVNDVILSVSRHAFLRNGGVVGCIRVVREMGVL